ncbi:permease [Arthrobacter sp. SRS-W-1-2016]|uniref:permease n=1 Tax=Arthrobacter sp. SRS-W-1-2016 TaxID=1930254 RepID=UPI001C0B0055|nr:permease [Arthrobacter sp. SRS-W-1-2016]
MDWASVWKDIVGGLLLAGAFAAWVPQSWLQALFLAGNPVASTFWGPIIGPLLAMVSFVCSIGNVPLAAVLWNGGISLGGVVSFIFADLIIIPTGIFYLAMIAAGYVVELVFTPLGLVPAERNATVLESSITWNYTTWLNMAFLILGAFLLIRFIRTGGLGMLKMMGGEPAAIDGPGHDHTM